MSENWHNFKFFTPITEKIEVLNEATKLNDFVIKGTAINETTTHNGNKYVAEELQKAGKDLIGKKLLVDHRNEVDAIKGVVTNSFFDAGTKSIKFEAVVKDKLMQEMISDGRLSDVSIGAYASDMVKEEDGSYRAKGLKIMELSLVAVPADSKANFGMALAQSISLKESLQSLQETSNLSNERRFKQMTEENKFTELEEANKKLLEELTAMKEQRRSGKISEYKKLCSEKKVSEKDLSKYSEDTIDILIESLKDIKIVEEKKEMKSVVSNEVKEDYKGMDNFMIERSEYGKGYSVFAMPDSKGNIRLNR